MTQRYAGRPLPCYLCGHAAIMGWPGESFAYNAHPSVLCKRPGCPHQPGPFVPLPIWDAASYAVRPDGGPPEIETTATAAALIVAELLVQLWAGIKAAPYHPTITWTLADMLPDYPRRHADDAVDAFAYALHSMAARRVGVGGG